MTGPRRWCSFVAGLTAVTPLLIWLLMSCGAPHRIRKASVIKAADPPYRTEARRAARYPLPGFRLSTSLRIDPVCDAVRWTYGSGYTNAANCIHGLRLRNELGRLRQTTQSIDHATIRQMELMEQVLVDGAEMESRRGGVPLLVETMHGVAYRTVPRKGERTLASAGLVGGVAHSDQVLATFAELGEPLTRRLRAASPAASHAWHESCLEALLRDSLMRFSSDRELEWSLVAYCCYLEHGRWKNAKGEERAISDVAQQLMDMRPGQGACLGTHRVYALGYYYDWVSQRSRHALGRGELATLRRLEGYLAILADALQRSQRADGSWGEDWSRYVPRAILRDEAPDEVARYEAKITATGHLLEFLSLLPPEIRAEEPIVRRAVDFLYGEVTRNREYVLDKLTLPTVHAICALIALSEDTELGGSAAGQGQDTTACRPESTAAGRAPGNSCRATRRCDGLPR